MRTIFVATLKKIDNSTNHAADQFELKLHRCRQAERDREKFDLSQPAGKIVLAFPCVIDSYMDVAVHMQIFFSIALPVSSSS